MSSNIIQLSDFKGRGNKNGRSSYQQPATETAKNSRIRSERREVWRNAERLSQYWRGRLDWHSTLERAQQYGIADSASYPSAAEENRFEIVEIWRQAIVNQLLTAASDAAAVNWKRAKLKSGDFPYLPVKKERVERAIADDEAFLAARPTRTSSNPA